MNYDEARQLGPESDAPGAWNWTTMNDGVIRTAPPCAWPDFDWDSVPVEDIIAGRVTPTGRERCDHALREDAEIHQWSDELDRLRIEPIDVDAVRSLDRCAVPDCSEWQTHRASGPWMSDPLCSFHATRDALALIHPFHAGRSVIHS